MNLLNDFDFEYSLNNEFLDKFSQEQNREIYIRIISLSNEEYPREQIEGRVTGGSINIDGSSTVRRSCSLSMVALKNDIIITDTYWCFNNKFKLQIGVLNSIDIAKPEIIWFDKGIYIISSFSINQSVNTLNISISGKDKMCRLNGEISGNLPMNNDFGTEEFVEEIPCRDTEGNLTGEYTEQITITKIPLSKIIRCAVKEYAQERDDNIIINDLPEQGYELWDYRGDTPMFLFIEAKDGIPPSATAEMRYINLTFDENTILKDNETNDIALKNIQQYYNLNSLDSDYNENATIVKYGNTTIVVAKIEYGETAGYHNTPLVYSGDLLLSAGETVTTMLDKIKSMLGNYEYFYDLRGRFIFQKKKTYIQDLFSPINGSQITPIAMATPYAYKFKDTKLFTQIASSPNIANVKNEYVVWGARKGATGIDLPIHARYAIQKKPMSYTSPYAKYEKIEDIGYKLENNGKITLVKTPVDGVTDLTVYQQEGDTYIEFSTEGLYYREIGVTVIQGENLNQFYKECTGTETADLTKYHYYKQIQAGITYTAEEYDWRELIYQMAKDYYAHNLEIDFLQTIEKANKQFIGGRTGFEQYYSDFEAFWRQIYNPNPSLLDIANYGEFYTGEDVDKYWNKSIHKDPTCLNFWFDFLDSGGEISNYSVDKIGTRIKVVNDTSLRSIYYKETPEVEFIVYPREKNKFTQTEQENGQLALDKLIIQENMEHLFYRSTQGQSIIEKINSLINTHAMQTAGLNLTTIPIYHLEPNTRIYIEGYGDYTLDKISFSLNYNATMSLTCTKIMTSII